MFCLINKNVIFLSERTSASDQLNARQMTLYDEPISEKVTNDGARTATDCVAPDDNGRVYSPVKRKRGKEKSAFPESGSKQVSKQSGKAVTKTPANEGAKNGSNMSQTHKTALHPAERCSGMLGFSMLILDCS